MSVSGDNRHPITIVTGFLGSGKTTLLANVLRDKRFRNTAAIINEFGAICGRIWSMN